MTTQRRAKRGGERGANGELYSGGTWINTVEDRPKGTPAERPVRPTPAWIVERTRNALDGYAARARRRDVDFANPCIRGEIQYYLRTVGAAGCGEWIDLLPALTE